MSKQGNTTLIDKNTGEIITAIEIKNKPITPEFTDVAALYAATHMKNTAEQAIAENLKNPKIRKMTGIDKGFEQDVASPRLAETVFPSELKPGFLKRIFNIIKSIPSLIKTEIAERKIPDLTAKLEEASRDSDVTDRSSISSERSSISESSSMDVNRGSIEDDKVHSIRRSLSKISMPEQPSKIVAFGNFVAANLKKAVGMKR